MSSIEFIEKRKKKRKKVVVVASSSSWEEIGFRSFRENPFLRPPSLSLGETERKKKRDEKVLGQVVLLLAASKTSSKACFVPYRQQLKMFY